MRSLLIDHWIRVKSSYWFVPTLMCVGATVLAALAVRHSDILGNADRFLLPLRQFSRGDAITTISLIEMLGRAVRFAGSHKNLEQALRNHLAELEADAVPAIESTPMRENAKGRLAAALRG